MTAKQTRTFDGTMQITKQMTSITSVLNMLTRALRKLVDVSCLNKDNNKVSSLALSNHKSITYH